jgi:hypothetical protein
MSRNEQTITDATRRVTHWMIGVRGEVPLVEELATAEDVQSFVRGHVRWVDGTPGPAIELGCPSHTDEFPTAFQRKLTFHNTLNVMFLK